MAAATAIETGSEDVSAADVVAVALNSSPKEF